MTPRYTRLADVMKSQEVYKEKQRLRYHENLKKEMEKNRQATIEMLKKGK